jgi:hypothetical protein
MRSIGQGIAAITLTASLLSATAPYAQTCPSYTHKEDVTEGTAASLPAGFMIFGVANRTGVYKSPIQQFDTTRIPGTSSDLVMSMDISDDGQWVEYVKYTSVGGGKIASAGVYITSLDGSRRAMVPTAEANAPLVAGFLHGSPYGMEIFYYDQVNSGTKAMGAVLVDVSGSQILFPRDRVILDFSATTDALWPYGGTNVVTAARDAIFGIMGQASAGSPTAVYNQFVTIPDSGRGTATAADMYQWTNPSSTSLWGCGQTITHDATICLTNSGQVGSSCVPNQTQTPTMDHKGFYVTPFFRPTDPPMAINQQSDSAGLSINWCPLRFRTGTYSQCEFNYWSFSNSNDLVIGESRGSLATTWGLWVVNWRNNVWTLVSPNQKTVEFTEPAMFLTGMSSAVGGKSVARTAGLRIAATRSIAPGVRTVALPAGMAGLQFLSLSGKVIWEYHRAGSAASSTILIPSRLAGAPAIVRYLPESVR